MADNIIELRHISKVYSDNGFKAVDDFNLEVKRGEFVTFLDHPDVVRLLH